MQTLLSGQEAVDTVEIARHPLGSFEAILVLRALERQVGNLG